MAPFTPWHPFGNGDWPVGPYGYNFGVSALTVYNDQLIVGGKFAFPITEDETAHYIAAWYDSAWHTLGLGLALTVYALTVYDDQLIAGGNFNLAGSSVTNSWESADYIAIWKDLTWQALGSGMRSTPVGDPIGDLGGDLIGTIVEAVTVYNGELIAGGRFTSAGDVSARAIAAWNGSGWRPVGNGIDFEVKALIVYKGNLIAGGWFNSAGAVKANGIAVWDGSDWQAIGGDAANLVNALTVYNDQLIAGGSFFTTPEGLAGNSIASWSQP